MTQPLIWKKLAPCIWNVKDFDQKMIGVEDVQTAIKECVEELIGEADLIIKNRELKSEYRAGVMTMKDKIEQILGRSG